MNDGALLPNNPNDISSLNNECCHAATQPSAGYLIVLRSGCWRYAVRQVLVLVLGRVSRCRVRDNDVLMSLSVSSTRRPCTRGAASRAASLLTAAAAARTVMEVTGVTRDSHEAAVTEVTQQVVRDQQQPAHN